jgi:hypothetical protein
MKEITTCLTVILICAQFAIISATEPIEEQTTVSSPEQAQVVDSISLKSDTITATRAVNWFGEFNYQVLQVVNAGGRHLDSVDVFGDRRRLDRQWFHRLTGEAGVKIQPREDLFFKIGFRLGTASSGLSECKVVYNRSKLSVTGGLFQYKYNQDVKNLGEYLIMSGCYPGYVFSGREWATNTGLLFSTELIKGFKQDLLITSAMEQIPYYDFSISYIASYGIGQSLDVGAGVMLYNLIPVRPEFTELDIDQNLSEYSHRGVKLMGRFSFDVKKLFGEPDVMGNEDLKLYAEGAVLGVKNYIDDKDSVGVIQYYDTLSQRIPVMLGFNIPAFGLLDYLSLELEYYGSPYDNKPIDDIYDVLPPPDHIGHSDDIKWSVSLKRSINNKLSFYARAASDHLRLEDASGGVEKWERLSDISNWYWSSKIILSF